MNARLSQRSRPVARFDDSTEGGHALELSEPTAVISARTTSEVRAALVTVEAAVAQGQYAAGFLAYEAGAAFGLPTLAPSDNPSALPLVWFALFDEVTEVAPLSLGLGPLTYRSSDWSLDTSREHYSERLRAVREAIARGETYQTNLTVRLNGSLRGDDFAFYRDLALAQRGAYACYLDLGDYAVASASPELFFEWRGDTISTRPMKGTTTRGKNSAGDLAAVRALLASDKERAENLMIVDLMRNDLGRIAEIGSVKVPELFAVERYETVWQLTSEVTATVRPDLGLTDVLAALFPSGSVTGAPKHSSMALIADLEDSPRGVYCGAIGLLSPPGSEVRARFSVAIRTAVIDRAHASAVYGTGGGITWGSVEQSEYAELVAKTAIVRNFPRTFGLIETLGFAPGEGLRNEDRHLARLADSAAYFGFHLDVDDARSALRAATTDADTPLRVRLELARDGEVEVTTARLRATHGSLRLALDLEPVASSAIWSAHKTTRRDVYEQRAARHPEADDVILINERGELTETTIANLALLLDGYWYTPPLSSGCLPGVGRAVALDEGRCRERVLRLSDLERADAIATVSSLRGFRLGRLVAEPAMIA